MSKLENWPPKKIQEKNARFYLIDKAEVLSGIKLSSKNAESLFDSAVLVQTNIDNVGVANSLLILAAEESIKAFVLFAVLMNIPVPFVLDFIFSKHFVKHARGREINQVVESISVLIPFVRFARSKRNNSFAKTISTILNIGSRTEWWDSADKKRNKGFYVDLVDGRFISPSDMTENEFNTSKNLVREYVELLKIIANTPDEEIKPLVDIAKARKLPFISK